MLPAPCRRAGRPPRLGALLGVVYGDIGTSPLYAFKSCLDLLHDHAAAEWEVLGLLSLIFWALLLIVTVKYVLLVMRADNRGEGGILALVVLAQRVWRRWLFRVMERNAASGAEFLRIPADRVVELGLCVAI